MLGNTGNGIPVSIPLNTGGNGFGNNSFDDIIALAVVAMIFGGWGRGGGIFGGNGGGGLQYSIGVPATQSDIFQQTLISKLDGNTYGIADLGYALNNTITNGFSAAELSRCNNQSALINQMHNDQIANMQNQFALQTQLSNCCCENKQLTMQSEYNAQARNAATNTQIATATRDITDNANAGYKAIIDKLCQMENNAKDEKIADQAQKINALQLAASQAAQNNYLVNQLRPAPVPAYTVPNPFCNCGNYGYFGGTTIA